MKGIAILGIMLHNYSHWLKGIIRENEYTWLQWKCDKLWEVIQQPDANLPLHLVSFFGHYGVPVFLFLSGFGLVKKYEQGSLPDVGIWRFIRYNYLKLFRIFIVGFVLFTLLDAFTPAMHRYTWLEVVGMLGKFLRASLAGRVARTLLVLQRHPPALYPLPSVALPLASLGCRGGADGGLLDLAIVLLRRYGDA